LYNADKINGINLEVGPEATKVLLRFRVHDILKTAQNLKERGLIDAAEYITGNYYLTEKGKRLAISIKNKLDYKDYYELISNFPEIEIKDRIENIEKFIIGMIFLSVGTFSLLNKLFIIQIGTSFGIYDFILTSIASVLLFLFFLVAFSLSSLALMKIAFFYGITLKRDTTWKYKEFLWNNQKNIMYAILALAVIVIVYCLATFLLSWNVVIGGIILGIVVDFIINPNRAISRLSKLKICILGSKVSSRKTTVS